MPINNLPNIIFINETIKPSIPNINTKVIKGITIRFNNTEYTGYSK